MVLTKKERIAHETLGAYMSLADLGRMYKWDSAKFLRELDRIKEDYRSRINKEG